MKKWSYLVAGILIGAMLFGGIPAFADTVKGILGAKVTGVYTVKKANGAKVAEGAILNGSTYVPVRAISEAAGIPLTVDTKGKVIVMGEGTSATSNVQVDELNIKKSAVSREIQSLQGMVILYETDIIPRAQEAAKNTKGTESEATYQSRLDERTKELEKYKSDLAEAQKQLAEIEAQIAEFQK
ncbi:hypothetical protein ACL02P_15295 [Paenibacillus sp. MB22_1]|uniref:hypothetical protein n=1 Tax=Paenibacillus sp. MB22_1 TaxID=3383121 RepID=UPI0039A07452